MLALGNIPSGGELAAFSMGSTYSEVIGLMRGWVGLGWIRTPARGCAVDAVRAVCGMMMRACVCVQEGEGASYIPGMMYHQEDGEPMLKQQVRREHVLQHLFPDTNPSPIHMLPSSLPPTNCCPSCVCRVQPFAFGDYLSAEALWLQNTTVAASEPVCLVIWLHPYSYNTGYSPQYGQAVKPPTTCSNLAISFRLFDSGTLMGDCGVVWSRQDVRKAVAREAGCVVMAFDQVGFGIRVVQGAAPTAGGTASWISSSPHPDVNVHVEMGREVGRARHRQEWCRGAPSTFEYLESTGMYLSRPECVRAGGNKFYARHGGSASLLGQMVKDVQAAVDFMLCRSPAHRHDAAVCSQHGMSQPLGPSRQSALSLSLLLFY